MDEIQSLCSTCITHDVKLWCLLYFYEIQFCDAMQCKDVRWHQLRNLWLWRATHPCAPLVCLSHKHCAALCHSWEYLILVYVKLRCSQSCTYAMGTLKLILDLSHHCPINAHMISTEQTHSSWVQKNKKNLKEVFLRYTNLFCQSWRWTNKNSPELFEKSAIWKL